MRPALLVLAALILAGCGQTGGLYLPDEPAAAVEQTTTPAATPDAAAAEVPAAEDEAARTRKK